MKISTQIVTCFSNLLFGFLFGRAGVLGRMTYALTHRRAVRGSLRSWPTATASRPLPSLTLLAFVLVSFAACTKTDGNLSAPCTLGRTTDCGNVVKASDAAQYNKIEGLYIMHNLRMEMLNGRVFNYPNAGRPEKTLICFSTSGQQKAFLNDKLACVNCYTFGQDSLTQKPTLELHGVENKPCRNLLPHGIWEIKGDTLFVSYTDSIKNNVYSLLRYDYEKGK